MPTQDELLAALARGDYGPWAGQGFVPGGITYLDPNTWQWVTIVGTPGSADVEMTVGDPVDASSLEEGPDVQGLPISAGVTPSVGGGSFGHLNASAVPATSYAIADFTRTSLGEIRMTEGISNGHDGPLSPVRMGENRQSVDRDGNLWLPVVRMGGIDAERWREEEG